MGKTCHFYDFHFHSNLKNFVKYNLIGTYTKASKIYCCEHVTLAEPSPDYLEYFHLKVDVSVRLIESFKVQDRSHL